MVDLAIGSGLTVSVGDVLAALATGPKLQVEISMELGLTPDSARRHLRNLRAWGSSPSKVVPGNAALSIRSTSS